MEEEKSEVTVIRTPEDYDSDKFQNMPFTCFGGPAMKSIAKILTCAIRQVPIEVLDTKNEQYKAIVKCYCGLISLCTQDHPHDEFEKLYEEFKSKMFAKVEEMYDQLGDLIQKAK